MSPTIGLPPPPAEAILERSRASRYKGGTLVAEDVADLAEHERRLCDPDLYRPSECQRCGHGQLHVHDRPERRPKGDSSLPAALAVLVFRCTWPSCGASWRILPLFLARHLWHTWRAVERTVKPSAELSSPPDARPISARTEQRWRHRLASSGRMLSVLFAMTFGALAEISMAVGLSCTREAVLDAFMAVVAPARGALLSSFAALVHRLEPGVRLM